MITNYRLSGKVIFRLASIKNSEGVIPRQGENVILNDKTYEVSRVVHEPECRIPDSEAAQDGYIPYFAYVVTIFLREI